MTKTETIITDIYDAWRAQDIGWLASYLPDDFSHMIYLPPEVSPRLAACCCENVTEIIIRVRRFAHSPRRSARKLGPIRKGCGQ